MDVNEFNNWKKRFRKAIFEFVEEFERLVTLHNSVIIACDGSRKEMRQYTNGNWKRFGRGEAWYNVDKMKKEIKWAEKKFAFLRNVMDASKPIYLPFLDSYGPARAKWDELIKLMGGFESQLGVKHVKLCTDGLIKPLKVVGDMSFLTMRKKRRGGNNDCLAYVSDILDYFLSLNRYYSSYLPGHGEVRLWPCAVAIQAVADRCRVGIDARNDAMLYTDFYYKDWDSWELLDNGTSRVRNVY